MRQLIKMSFRRGFPTPSKTIWEFLNRHPEVQTGPQAKAQLDRIHEDDTFCIINKIFNNTILHQEYDGGTRKRVFAFAFVNEPDALAWYEDNKEDGNAKEICDCKIGEIEGQDHHLHDSIVEAEKADCEKHKGYDEPDPDCSACWPVLCGNNCRW